MYYQQRKLPLVVKKSNDLVRTQLSVENNALANKIFVTLIRNLTDDSFPEASISPSQVVDSENRGSGDYKRVKKAAEVLMKARVDSLEYDHTGKETGFYMVNIFESCRYKDGKIKAVFSSSLKPHLLGLKNHFTSLNYFDLIELSSFYSQRIYELLKSWEKPNGFVEIRLDVLYDLISFPVNLRTNFKDVRKRAIEQAEKEINKKTEMSFRWEPIKEGCKVVAIRFVIGERGQKTDKKRQIKKQEKKRQEGHEDAARRKPHLLAARQCRLDHGTKSGDICKLAKPRSKKCQLCTKLAEVKFDSQGGLFDS